MKNKSNILLLTLHTVCLCIVGSLIIGIISSIGLFKSLIQEYNLMFMLNSPFFIFFAVIIAPLWEEFIFRKIIFDFLKKKTRFYNFIQAAIFSIIHWNPIQSIYTFFFGIFMGNVKDLTGSTWKTIYLHIIFNLTGIYYPLVIQNLYTNSSSFHANTGIIISGLIFIPFILFFITLKMMGKGMYRFVKDKNSIID